MKRTKDETIKAEEFDQKFDAGENVIEHLDIENIKKPVVPPRRVNVDFPQWMIDSLDKEAKRIGVPRQALIKLWISERLEKTPAEVS